MAFRTSRGPSKTPPWRPTLQGSWKVTTVRSSGFFSLSLPSLYSIAMNSEGASTSKGSGLPSASAA